MRHQREPGVGVARYGDIILSGKSGEKFCFQTWPFGTPFRSVGAVFFVTKRLITDKTFRRASHSVIFIGQSANMAGPLGTQPQLSAFEKHGANCICVCAIADEAQRRNIVEDMVEGHHPLLAN